MMFSCLSKNIPWMLSSSRLGHLWSIKAGGDVFIDMIFILLSSSVLTKVDAITTNPRVSDVLGIGFCRFYSRLSTQTWIKRHETKDVGIAWPTWSCRRVRPLEIGVDVRHTCRRRSGPRWSKWRHLPDIFRCKVGSCCLDQDKTCPNWTRSFDQTSLHYQKHSSPLGIPSASRSGVNAHIWFGGCTSGLHFRLQGIDTVKKWKLILNTTFTFDWRLTFSFVRLPWNNFCDMKCI